MPIRSPKSSSVDPGQYLLLVTSSTELRRRKNPPTPPKSQPGGGGDWARQPSGTKNPRGFEVRLATLEFFCPKFSLLWSTVSPSTSSSFSSSSSSTSLFYVGRILHHSGTPLPPLKISGNTNWPILSTSVYSVCGNWGQVKKNCCPVYVPPLLGKKGAHTHGTSVEVPLNSVAICGEQHSDFLGVLSRPPFFC